jgi:hypothetical protein
MKPAGHRNLFNADANVFMYKFRPQSYLYRAPGEPLTAAVIHRYVDVLADSGVDTFLINPFCQLAWYPSKNIPTVFNGYRRGDRSFFYGHILGWQMTPEQIETYLAESTHMMDSYLDLVEAGVDWLAEVAAACRRRAISPWVSVRMNDMHGATKLIEASYMNVALFKDPAMRLRGTTWNRNAPVENGWQGFDYAEPEVRDYMLAAVRDMVENYDYEGLELDWTRWPLCCEPDASQDTIDTITEWHAEIRRVTERQAEKIGKPYSLGIKYLGTLEQMRGIGLDLREMARQGIIDFVLPTNSWQTSWDIPCDELRAEMGPEVAVYGVVEIAPNWLQGWLPQQAKGNAGLGSELAVDYRLTPACPPILRGNAAAKLVLGVDGIEVYNYPPADQPSHWPWEDEPCRAEYTALKGVEDLEFLRGQPKFYTFPSQTGYYQHQLFESVGPFPTVLGPCERRATRLPMCAETAETLEFVIQVVVEKKDTLPPVGVYFNGCWPNFDAAPDERLLFPVATMTHHTPDHLGLTFTFPLSSIREGWNEIVVMNGAPKDFWKDQSADYVTVVSLELAVRRPAK